MREYEDLLHKAQKELRVGDHLLTQSFPVLKDTKILLGVLHNLCNAVNSGMDALLMYERIFKRIPPYQETFHYKLEIFKEIAQKNSFDKNYVKIIQDLNNLLKYHKDSPMEFARKKHFVICDEEYSMEKLTQNKLKNIFSIAKLFIDDVDLVLKTYKTEI
ncbi:hypothetical protein ACFL0W_04190 [Nanoarchaeota archaeon]